MATTSAAARQLSDLNSQGTILGRNSSDLISFYGATPSARGTTANRLIGRLRGIDRRNHDQHARAGERLAGRRSEHLRNPENKRIDRRCLTCIL